MKTITNYKLRIKFVIFVLSILSQFLYSQDYEPTQIKLRLGGLQGTFQYLSGNMPYFKQSQFFLCWEWENGGKILSSLNVLGDDNSVHDIDSSKVLTNASLLMKNEIYVGFPGPAMMNVRGIQYEPTLALDSNNPSQFVPRPGDTTHPVFGFVTRRGSIGTDSNFNRLIIDSTILSGTVILEKPWPDDQLIYTDDPDTSISNYYQCRTMYISINLRRFDNEMTDDSVLKIGLPFTMDDGITNDSIQFSQLPNPNKDSTFQLQNGRGLIRKLDSCPLYTKVFYITKNMLPPYSQNKDITISAFFICDGNPHFKTNPYLNYKTGSIKNLGIRITYMDSTCPLGIDWVRFETPYAQSFLRGDYDSMKKH